MSFLVLVCKVQHLFRENYLSAPLSIHSASNFHLNLAFRVFKLENIFS